MANIKGGRAARKRDRQNAKANKRNVAVKTRLHTEHKKLFKAADAGKKEDAEKEFKAFVSGLDKAVIFSMLPEERADAALDVIEEKFRSIRGGKGVAFTLPFSSVIGASVFNFLADNRMTLGR